MAQPLLAPPSVYMAERVAPKAYLHLLALMITGLPLNCPLGGAFSTIGSAKFRRCANSMLIGRGYNGGGPPHSIAMAGFARLASVAAMISQIKLKGLKGGYLEAGVWKGGVTVLAAAALQVHALGERAVYLCDSFEGLPAPRNGSARPDEGYYSRGAYKKKLSIGEEKAMASFARFGVPTDSVVTVKGFFVQSLPALREQLLARKERLAILRLDGDMYDSTVDTLYNLYDLLEVGGFAVVDDFGWYHGANMRLRGPASKGKSKSLYGCKDAVMDFRALHGIEDDEHAMHNIDGTGAWWVKARDLPIKRDRYLRTVSMQDGSGTASQRLLLQPTPLLSHIHYGRLKKRWEALDRNDTETPRWHPLSPQREISGSESLSEE